MILWHVLIAAIGIYNVTRHPMILHALDPSRAVMRKSAKSCSPSCKAVTTGAVFVRTKNYDILSGVVLALTGCEAMFAR
jgi:KUP system potassium uptake protein